MYYDKITQPFLVNTESCNADSRNKAVQFWFYFPNEQNNYLLSQYRSLDWVTLVDFIAKIGNLITIFKITLKKRQMNVLSKKP
jgi:hypothetical protein